MSKRGRGSIIFSSNEAEKPGTVVNDSFDHEKPAQETVYDLMLRIHEIERMDLPLLSAALHEPGLLDEDRGQREQTIQKLQHNVHQTSLLVAELVHAIERGDITFEKVQKHPQLKKIQKLLGEIEVVMKSGDIGDFLNKKKKEAEKQSVDREKNFLPPASFDPHWQTIEDVELANALLSYEIRNEIGQDQSQQQNAELVMSFLNDREVIKKTFDCRDLDDFEPIEGQTGDMSKFPFTLGWIKTHEPKVWLALVELSQGEAGKKMIKLLLGQGAQNTDLYPEFGSTQEKQSQEFMQALPNSLLIAVHNSGRLVHEGLQQGGSFTHEQAALTEFYGSLPEEMEYDADYYVVHIQIDQILEQAADGRDKAVLEEGLKFLQKPNKKALAWDRWNNFFVVLNKTWNNLSDDSRKEIEQACVNMANARQKRLVKIEEAIEKEKKWTEFSAEEHNIAVGDLYGAPSKFDRILSFLRSPVKSFVTRTADLAYKRFESAKTNEGIYIAEFLADLTEYHKCVDFLNQKSTEPHKMIDVNFAYLNSVAKAKAHIASDNVRFDKEFKNYDWKTAGNCDNWHLKFDNLNSPAPFRYGGKAKLSDVVTSLNGAILNSTDIGGIDWNNVPAAGADFTSANFSKPFDIEGGDFEEANFQGKTLLLGERNGFHKRANFKKANLKDVKFIVVPDLSGIIGAINPSKHNGKVPELSRIETLSNSVVMENPHFIASFIHSNRILADFSDAQLDTVNFGGIFIDGCFFDDIDSAPAWVVAGLKEEEVKVGEKKEKHDVFRNHTLVKKLFMDGFLTGGVNFKGAHIDFADLGLPDIVEFDGEKIKIHFDKGIQTLPSAPSLFGRLEPAVEKRIDNVQIRLDGSTFEDAFVSNLVGSGEIHSSTFDRSILDKCSFDKCRINNTSFREVVFNPFVAHRWFQQFSRQEQNLRGIEASVPPASVFINCEFKQVDFSESFLLGMYMGKTNFTDVKFVKTDFKPRNKVENYGKTIMHGLEVKDCVFTRVSFKEAKMGYSKFSGVVFKDVDFAGTEFNKAVFTNCDFSGVDLSLAQIEGAKFINPNNLSPLVSKYLDENGVYHSAQ